MSVDEMVEAAKEAEAFGANEFSIVTSGTKMNDRQELDRVIEAVRRIKAETKLETCCSLGLMELDHLKELKAAGLDRCHHNLETAASFFDKIVTTHTNEAEIRAEQKAKDALPDDFDPIATNKRISKIEAAIKEVKPDHSKSMEQYVAFYNKYAGDIEGWGAALKAVKIYEEKKDLLI